MEMTKLLVKDLMNGKFELFFDYVYKTKEYLIKVPKGFVTDYAEDDMSKMWQNNAM